MDQLLARKDTCFLKQNRALNMVTQTVELTALLKYFVNMYALLEYLNIELFRLGPLKQTWGAGRKDIISLLHSWNYKMKYGIEG